MAKEFEARYLDIDVIGTRKKILELGFIQIYPETLMTRIVYSLPIKDLTKHVRLRNEGNKITLTFKHEESQKLDGVNEVEIVVDNFNATNQFLIACGFKEFAHQETKREKYIKDNIEATIDTWPGLNPFIEIEAKDSKLVEEFSEKLGFSISNASFGRVTDVYEKVLGISPEEFNAFKHLTFDNFPKKK